MVRQEWGRMCVDGEGGGDFVTRTGQNALHAWPTHARDWCGGQLSRVFPSFMALFVSPPDRRVAGETDRVCSAQAARDSRAGMTHLR